MLAPKCCALVIAPARKDRVDNGLERPGSRGDCILHSWWHLGEYLAANEPVGFDLSRSCVVSMCWVMPRIARLRDIRVRIALDDFVTGYSSLSYLPRVPFDKIKIDRSFIKDITEKGGSCPIVRTAINIAVARDMTTAAEGVEKQEQREILRDLGCTQMQGYVSSPPVPPKQLNELLFGQGAATATTAA
jgi:predicted signal transduction protein with EAL and GGDEF domain